LKRGRPSGGAYPVFEDATMKPDIHPNYHVIKVVMTNGEEYITRSTYGVDGGTLHLDIDPNTHPAWTGGSQQLMDRGGRLSRFNSRFAGLSLGAKK
jgi:large subunit ribosomal protein L31